MVFAHSLAGQPREQWEPLSHHLQAVGRTTAEFAEPFGMAAAARVAGLLHDIGKNSAAFQSYIATGDDEAAGRRRGPDHSTAGARVAWELYSAWPGRMLALAIAGHHAGLADGPELDRRLHKDYVIEDYDGWQAHSGAPPAARDLTPTVRFNRSPHSTHQGFTESFLTRMLFSCLVDADFLETEKFYARGRGETVRRGGYAPLDVLRDRLRQHMEGVGRAAADTPVNALRARVLRHAVARAEMPTGLFTLTVPTGGGKTLASLSFALEHAVRHRLRRVVYVIPYTSIIEQTADVFRHALKTTDDILEHHANFDWERGASTDGMTASDDEGRAGLNKLRRAAENWDAPIIVTTAVQFFESLFANRASRCRKLHNLAGAVIVLDEAQTLPLPVLRPCMAALDELCRNYGASVVLCTATQPALLSRDGFTGGFDIPSDRELAPDPPALYAALKRVTIDTRPEPITDLEIAARFADSDQMLCIVNSRAHARDLFTAIGGLPGATHLSTLMCPRHRRAVLGDVRARLKARQPVRLVATSLIEAGVDVDFPEVWRAAAGLDSIAQAAGRCNREGSPNHGRVVVFTPSDATPPRSLEAFWQAARPIIRGYEDILGLDAVRAYFKELYWQKGDRALDEIEIDGRVGVLAAIRERARTFSFPFRSIAENFRLIDDIMEPVIVPWEPDPADGDATQVFRTIRMMDRPRRSDLRRLQQYTVSIPRRDRDAWLARGALLPVHPAMGDALLRFDDLAHYRPGTGLDLADTAARSAESNIIG
jgi:CRISPR-associated endonuclease/helicase Cas3